LDDFQKVLVPGEASLGPRESIAAGAATAESLCVALLACLLGMLDSRFFSLWILFSLLQTSRSLLLLVPRKLVLDPQHSELPGWWLYYVGRTPADPYSCTVHLTVQAQPVCRIISCHARFLSADHAAPRQTQTTYLLLSGGTVISVFGTCLS
jgi:hypothetical protein